MSTLKSRYTLYQSVQNLLPPLVLFKNVKIKAHKCKRCPFIVSLNTVLYHTDSSPNIVQVIKSRRMRWVGHVAHMGERRGVYRVFGGETWGKETACKTLA